MSDELLVGRTHGVFFQGVPAGQTRRRLDVVAKLAVLLLHALEGPGTPTTYTRKALTLYTGQVPRGRCSFCTYMHLQACMPSAHDSWQLPMAADYG